MKETLQSIKEKINYILNDNNTIKVNYSDYTQSFDYVTNIYPSIDVKSCNVYLVPKSTLIKIKYAHAGGFYDIVTRTIVINKDAADSYSGEGTAKMTVDEIIVHELIHFCANYTFPVSSKKLEEEIAYSKSVGYLRAKGMTDDEIIRYNMMPYLIGLVNTFDVGIKLLIDKGLSEKQVLKVANDIKNNKKPKLLKTCEKELKEQVMAEAYKFGEQFIKIYDDKYMGHKNPIMSENKRKTINMDDDVI